ARALAALLSGADYRAVRPAGLQEALFTLGLPGTVRPGVVREFTQHQVSEDWALSGAFTLGEVGDPARGDVGVMPCVVDAQVPGGQPAHQSYRQ
ncbi:hypothetical protein TN53_42695, partial [Streptomyces sp. WM6386]